MKGRKEERRERKNKKKKNERGEKEKEATRDGGWNHSGVEPEFPLPPPPLSRIWLMDGFMGMYLYGFKRRFRAHTRCTQGAYVWIRVYNPLDLN